MTDERDLFPRRRADLAAEYALGVLSGAERAQAISLARADATFASEVARWRGRLAPLFGEVAAVEPPVRAWAAIERRIGDPAPNASVVALNRRLNRWRAFAVATSAIAASLAIVMVGRPQAPLAPTHVEQPPPLVATLASAQTSARLVATWDPSRRSLIVAAAAGVRPSAGKDHELWIIPAGGTPQAVGIIRPAGATRMTLNDGLAQRLARGATLAVSIEPAGGSPTGLPTGPVIATGILQQT